MGPVRLDGSLHEGGGAMLRQALGFSMLLKKPFIIDDVRKNREKPGLAWQHLSALNAAHQVCNARVEGNRLGSTKVSFAPGPIKNTRPTIDIGTAGSSTLLLQAFLLPALFSGKNFHITIKGGTDVKWSMPVDYLNKVLLPQFRKYGDISLRVLKRGFYPKGGGLVTFIAKGKYILGAQTPPSINLVEQGDLFKIAGVSYASADLQPSEVAERQTEAARMSLSRLGVEVDILSSYTASSSTGSGVVLWAVCGNKEGLNPNNPIVLGGSALGERQLRAETVGQEAASSLRAVIDARAACDEHLADQLIPFMALFGGKIKTTKITNHVRSNIYVAEQFLNTKFLVDEETSLISCEPATF